MINVSSWSSYYGPATVYDHLHGLYFVINKQNIMSQLNNFKFVLFSWEKIYSLSSMNRIDSRKCWQFLSRKKIWKQDVVFVCLSDIWNLLKFEYLILIDFPKYNGTTHMLPI